MNKKDKQNVSKISREYTEKIIAMVIRLYMIMVKSEPETIINEYETNTLYTLLENLFRNEDISWEYYVRNIMKSELSYDEVITFLNKNLITLDKIRILLSLIVLANADSDLATSEVTKILELAKALNLETHGFMNIINYIEYNQTEPVSMAGFKYFLHTQRSIFKDFLVIGSRNTVDICFKDRKVSNVELVVMVIEEDIFIGTSSDTTAAINGIDLKPNRLYTFPDNAILEIGSVFFKYEHLKKMYQSKYYYDIIDFKKPDYDFKVINDKNHYSIVVNRGTIYKNGKVVPLHKASVLFFDDVIQIKGYDPFWLIDVIEHRGEIGTEQLYPEEIFINLENEYYYVSRVDTQHSLIRIFSEESKLYIEPPIKKGRQWSLYLNNEKVTSVVPFNLNTDIITINKSNFRVNSFFDLMEIPFEVDQMSFLDLKHYFKDGHLALDGISFEVHKSELMAIMGPSGSGKSTLLKTISTEIIPKYGSVVMDGKDFYQNLNYFKQYIGYVPQEDLLFSELTVFENLLYRGRLQMPHLSSEHLEQKINNLLIQLKLTHRKNVRVGQETHTLLSGGERKRLNIALELLFEPTIVICDEPTSGLSSTDSEQIIEMLKDLTKHGKIVIITIHQPNPSIFQRFDKVLLMDTGGKQVFFGDTEEAFNYFDTELEQITERKELIEKKKHLKMSEYIFDIIEYPSYKENGELVFEQVSQNLVVKRQFTPEYWRDKFKRKILFDLMLHDHSSHGSENEKDMDQKERKADLETYFIQFKTFLIRNVLLKLRNRSNMFITFLEAPVLALVIAFILRLAPLQEKYSYYGNINLGVFLFISIIVFIFLGLSNSIEDIMGERRSIIREKMLNIRIHFYIVSKFTALSIFALIQVVLYVVVTNLILGIKGVTFANIAYFFLADMIGFSLGLLISTFLNNTKAIINILPAILIPQIIFGGAIIQYDKMNRNLKIFKKNPIPEVVQAIPSRWLFEGLYTSQAKLNAYDYNLDRYEKKRLTLVNNLKNGSISRSTYRSLLNDIYRGKKEAANKYTKEKYTNEDVRLVVNMMDGKFLNSGKNVFLSSYKLVFGKRCHTYYFNMLVILLYVIIFNIFTYIRLKFFYNE